MKITATPTTQSLYRLRHHAYTVDIPSPANLPGAIGEAVFGAIQQMRAMGRDYQDYTYEVSFEEDRRENR